MDKDYHDDIEWFYEHRKEYGENVLEEELECYSCHFETEVSIYRNCHPPRFAWFCEVCASSYAGSAYWYPRQYDASMMTHIAMCTNLILDAIKRREAV